jgi:choloylglycine hydrolase
MISSYCTAVGFTCKDGTILYGRTLEYESPLYSQILFLPRNHPFEGTAFHRKGKSWISKYALLGFNQNAMPHYRDWIVDGMNEQGLVASALYLSHYTEYQPYNPSFIDRTIGCWELVTLLLSQCSSLEDVRQEVHSICVADQPLLFDTSLSIIQPTFHYMVMDRSGKALVIEYTHSKLQIYHNPFLVLTNAPPFPQQVRLWEQFQKTHSISAVDLPFGTNGIWSTGSGMIGLPGDFTSTSRFQRIIELKHWMRPARDEKEGIKSMFHLLESVAIAKGWIRTKGDLSGKLDSYTQWTVVYDIHRLRLYFRTYDGMEINEIIMKPEHPKKFVWNLSSSLHIHVLQTPST